MHTASALTAFALTRLFATPLRGLSGHFASLVLSKHCRHGLSRHFASLVGCKRLAHSRLSHSLGSSPRRFVAYRGTSLHSWGAHGFRTHGFCTHSSLRHASSRLIGALRFAGAFKTVPSRLIGALRFARGVHTASALTAFALTRLFATPLRGLSGHFASLVVSNKCRLPIRNLNRNSHLSQKVPITHKEFEPKFPLFET